MVNMETTNNATMQISETSTQLTNVDDQLWGGECKYLYAHVNAHVYIYVYTCINVNKYMYKYIWIFI